MKIANGPIIYIVTGIIILVLALCASFFDKPLNHLCRIVKGK